MAKQDFYNMIDIKNKFDVITETLNIFDLSFLVSGSVMLGLCFFAFPIMRDFFIHGNHLFLSIVLCIWFSYVLGLICRTIGMNISKCFYNFGHCDKETNIKELYSSCFPKIFGKKINSDSTSYHIEKADFAYSYMWMKLDTSKNPDCKNRFLYVSRIWVLRAIYEGLIPSIIFFSIIILCNGDLCQLSINAFGRYAAYIGIPIIMILDLICIALLAKEAHHCNETLRREIFVAYFDFFGKRDDSCINKDKDTIS